MTKITQTKAVNSLLNASQAKESFDATKGECYTQVALYMSSEGLTLQDFTAKVAASKGSDWPKTAEGQPLGKNKAAEQGSRYAVAIQRFGVWYGQNVAQDAEKVPMVDDKNGELVKKEKTSKGAQSRKNPESTSSKAVTLTGDELLEKAFADMVAKVEKRRASVKKRAQIAECEEISIMIEELKEFFQAVNA